MNDEMTRGPHRRAQNVVSARANAKSDSDLASEPSGMATSDPHSTRRHVPSLDGWRGIAIGLVLFSHFVAGDTMGADYGRAGVDLFFALSGMLMSGILFSGTTSLGTFYRRRISRVFPAFLGYCLIVYGVAAWLGRWVGWESFFTTILFLRTYLPSSPDIWHSGFPISHLWSLNVEEHCYLLLGVLAFFPFTRRHAMPLLIGAGTLALLTLVFYFRYPHYAPALPSLRSETASAGLLLSAGYALLKDRVRIPLRRFVALGALGGGLLCYYWRAPWWAASLVAPVLFALAVNHLADAPAFVTSLLSTRWLRQLGLWSFSIYLWQQPWYTFKGFLWQGAALPGVFVCSLVSFYGLEKPLRLWLNRRGNRERGPAATSPPATG